MAYDEMMHTGSGDNVGRDKIVINAGGTRLPSISKEAYIDHLRKQHSKLQMLGFNRELDIEKIFITLTVSPENISGEKVSYDSRGISVEAPISELYLNRDKGTPYRLSMSTPVSLPYILSCQKSIVLGEPGAGKTTLLKHLLLDVCAGRICSGFLPIFIKIAEINVFNTGCIKRFLRHRYPESFQMINDALVSGNALIFLDGFDEISSSEQNIISSEISNLSTPQNKICLSCRTSVFPANVLSSDFRIFECFGFSIPQRKRFVSNWFSSDPVLAQKIKQEIFGDYCILGLSRNPLLLSLMALEFEQSTSFRLNKKRIEVYLGAIDILVNKREVYIADEVHNEVKKTLLQQIAYYLSNNNTDKLNRKELANLIKEWKVEYSSIGEDTDNVSTKTIVDWVISTGIIVSESSQSTATQQFRFLHLTLQEALTAQYVLTNLDTFQYIKDNLGIPGKEETVRLILSKIDTDTAYRVLQYCCDYQAITQNTLRYNIVIGRYISDISYNNHFYFKHVFDTLIEYLIDSPTSLETNDVIVSLASICGSSVERLQYFSNSILSRTQYISTFINYISVLKLSPCPFSSAELTHLLWSISSKKDIQSELQIQLVGIIIEALEYTYDECLWIDLYEKYIKNYNSQKDSHLAGITANVLGQIQSDNVMDIIIARISSNIVELLDVAVLYKYVNYQHNKQIILSSLSCHCSDEVCGFIASTDDFETQLSDKDIITILSYSATYPKKVAYLLCSKPIVEDRDMTNSNEAILSLITDSKSFQVLRCAAFECCLKANKSNNDVLRKAIEILKEANDDNLFYIAIHALSYVTSYTFMDRLFATIQETAVSRMIVYALLSYLSTHVVKHYAITLWINENLYRWRNDTEISLLAYLALARHHDYSVKSKLMDFLKRATHEYEIIAVCKAIAILNTEDAPSILLSVLTEQTDIGIISSIINMLGTISSPMVDDALILFLDDKNWPEKWPDPAPPLKQGEQRPTDLRRLNIITSLGKRRTEKAYKELSNIINNNSESKVIKKAAQIAITNIDWKSRQF